MTSAPIGPTLNAKLDSPTQPKMRKYHVFGAIVGFLAVITGVVRLVENSHRGVIAQIALGTLLVGASLYWFRISND